MFTFSIPTRHAELVSASMLHPHQSVQAEQWTLKQVQDDGALLAKILPHRGRWIAQRDGGGAREGALPLLRLSLLGSPSTASRFPSPTGGGF
jgi:hypothetical protein